MVLNVIIVDDERLILMGLKACIEKIKDIQCSVRTAASGKQALLMLEEAPADLMVTDVEMIEMSGLTLIEKARAKNYCSHFIILSGYDKFEYARTACKLGVINYLLKPVDKEELRADICHLARELEQEEELDLMQPYLKFFPHLKKEEIPSSLKKSVQFMEEHYRDALSLAMLSEHVGKSENYLCSLFKKEWNTTFLEIVNELRLREAIYLLLYEPDMAVGDIAGKVGYRTERQLFRLIKGRLGQTPHQIREGRKKTTF